MSYHVQHRNSPCAKWRIGRCANPNGFTTLDAAVAHAQSLDEDGMFNTDSQSIRIVTGMGERVSFDKAWLQSVPKR